MADIEDLITEAILELLLTAKENGVSTLSFEEVCIMLGVDDISLMTKFERGIELEINEKFLDQLKDPEVRQAMIESFKATKH
tara:strand:+ start:8518 stop:8763 length:246 start_codon:yes stop_codon:yes gene_type:complete